MAKKRLTEWQKGVFYAAAIVLETADEPVIAGDIIRAAGLERAHCASLDDFEKDQLRKINGGKGLALTGLE